MAQFITVTPAYGRDYKKRADAVKDWKDGKDFVFQNVSSRYYGKYCSIRDFPVGTVVNIRYNELRQVAVIKVK